MTAASWVLLGLVLVLPAALFAFYAHLFAIERRETERYVERTTRELRESNKELIDQLMHATGHTWRYPSQRDEPIAAPDPFEAVYEDVGPEMDDGQ